MDINNTKFINERLGDVPNEVRDITAGITRFITTYCMYITILTRCRPELNINIIKLH